MKKFDKKNFSILIKNNMENKTNDITLMIAHTGQNTLAHEQLARDEQFVGVFFAAFAIQYANKKDSSVEFKNIKFLNLFKDIELYISQRSFIKTMIETKQFNPICAELIRLIDRPEKMEKTPYDYFLSTINKTNKGFLIRQIFSHTDQVLEKYRFISDFVNKDISQIDFEDLYKKMWHIPVEQQILVCVCIFSKIKDSFESKKKTIGFSYSEKTNKINTKNNSLKNEQYVSIFFAAFVIQYYLHKDFSTVPIETVEYLKPFKDIEIYASQRVFIKNIIIDKKYRILREEIKYLLFEYNSKRDKPPHKIFLSRINKDVQIKQIFSQRGDVLDKYKFIHDLSKKDVSEIDMNELHKKIWHFSIEQQILICVFLFSKINDEYDSKKKSIGDSFVENSIKIRDAFAKLGKNNGIDIKNYELFIRSFS